MPLKGRNIVNRLLGVVPTFDTFDTDPSSPENMTDGNWETESGEGVETVTVATGLNRVIGNIMFDMGAVYRVELKAWINIHKAAGDGYPTAYWMSSPDAINWYTGERMRIGNGVNVYRVSVVQHAYARYVGIRFLTSSVTVDPSVFHVKVAEVVAEETL